MTTFAFLGAGEFEPWSEAVDRWVLERTDGDGRVLILPTASALEGDDVFGSWAAKGLEHFGALGVEAEVVPIKTREDADDPANVARLERASAVYFSGGNPYHLASVLQGSSFCREMYASLDRGLGYIGCSAGVACLTETTYDTAVSDFTGGEVWKPGLGYVRQALFAPHWDVVDSWIPGAQAYIAASVGPGQVLIAIDEDTAMVGDGTDWEVLGTAEVHLLSDDLWDDHASGDRFRLALSI